MFATVFGWTVSAWLLYLAGLVVLSVFVGTHESTHRLSRPWRLAWLILFALPVGIALAAFLIWVGQPPLDGIPDF